MAQGDKDGEIPEAVSLFEKAFGEWLKENPYDLSKGAATQFVASFAGDDFVEQEDYKHGYFIKQDGTLFQNRDELLRVCANFLIIRTIDRTLTHEELVQGFEKALEDNPSASRIATAFAESALVAPPQALYAVRYPTKEELVPIERKVPIDKMFKVMYKVAKDPSKAAKYPIFDGCSVQKMGDEVFEVQTDSGAVVQITATAKSMMMEPSFTGNNINPSSLDLASKIMVLFNRDDIMLEFHSDRDSVKESMGQGYDTALEARATSPQQKQDHKKSSLVGGLGRRARKKLASIKTTLTRRNAELITREKKVEAEEGVKSKGFLSSLRKRFTGGKVSPSNHKP